MKKFLNIKITKDKAKKWLKDTSIETLKVVTMATIFSTCIYNWVAFAAEIPSPSMVPTLNVEDRLIVTRVHNLNKLQHGDIVVFKSEEGRYLANGEEAPNFNPYMIKRLIGMPGDKVVIDEGTVYVNDVKLEENYLGSHDKVSGYYLVPEHKYFFLGDNRLVSGDSRYWSDPYVDEKDIVGKAQYKFYPYDHIGKIK